MSQTKVVSIGMFRTLVDLESVERVIWHRLLKDKYTTALAEECTARAGNSLFNYLPQGKFLSVQSIFKACFSDFLSSVDVDFDAAEAAKVWTQMHSLSAPFGDSLIFLNSVGNKYPICLASDADDDMLGVLRQMYAFDHIFTSEQLGSYKANGDGKFFSAIINYYGLKPEEIIHIGDGRLEIVGARKAGIITCWLNRNRSTWLHDTKPDYEAKSLIVAASILGVNIDP